MNDSEELQERYDDALFALMLHDFALRRGERCLEQNRRLTEDPSAALPPAARRRCLRAMDQALRKRGRRQAAVSLGRALPRIAAAVLAAIMLWSAAYAVSPEVRRGTRNLFLRVSPSAAIWSFRDISTPSPAAELPLEDGELPNIQFNWLPEGSVLISREELHSEITQTYQDADGNIFCISLLEGSVTHTFDTESADQIDKLISKNRPGTAIEKDGAIWIDIVDEEYQVFISLYAQNISYDTLKKIADNIVLF